MGGVSCCRGPIANPAVTCAAAAVAMHKTYESVVGLGLPGNSAFERQSILYCIQHNQLLRVVRKPQHVRLSVCLSVC